MNNQNNSVWFLDKKCLLEYAINNRIIKIPQIGIVDCKDKIFENRCKNFRVGLRKEEDCQYHTRYNAILDDTIIEVTLYKNLSKDFYILIFS